MSYTYKEHHSPSVSEPRTEAPESAPSFAALCSGALKPTPAQTGHRVDLPEAMRQKMEAAFGADLSAVKLYESQTVKDAGAKAVTQGTNISFAPGMLDFSSYGGQALLGHELSHVVSQARGEARGSGFLNDPSLEARADREGAMAASGQRVAMPTAPLSAASAAPAAAPMQAALFKKDTAPKKDAFGFHTDPNEKLQLPPNGIGFMLGMENYGKDEDKPANQHEKSFRDMLEKLRGISYVRHRRNQVGGQLAFDAMMGNSYDSAISGLEGYKNQLLAEEEAENGKKNWFQRHFTSRSAKSKDRQRQLALLSDYIASAKADQAKNEALKSTTLMSEEDQGLLGKGDINAVRLFSRGKEDNKQEGVFKRDSIEAPHNGLQEAAEESVLQRIGLQYFDRRGKRIDNHLADREIAYARLASLVGASIGINAKRATFLRDPNIPLKGPINKKDSKSGDAGDVQPAPGEGPAPQPAASEGPAPQTAASEGPASQPAASKGPADMTVPGLGTVDVSDLLDISDSGSALSSSATDEPDSRPPEQKPEESEAEDSWYDQIQDFIPPKDAADDDSWANEDMIMNGVLMEKAEGKKWGDYNWEYIGPENEIPEDPYSDLMITPLFGQNQIIDEETGEDIHRKDSWGQRLEQNNIRLVRKRNRIADDAPYLNANDPGLQRGMNEMFLVDTLAQYTDRHSGNFHISPDENGHISVKTLDNDISFGNLGTEADNKLAFGKRGTARNYGGLPAQMLIDANMAKNIMRVTPKMLESTFSDILSPQEIAALGTRFEMMKKYILAQQKEDPTRIVSEWNDETAKRELQMAGGVGSHYHENITKPEGFSGNSYYQRMMMTLRASEYKFDKETREKIAYAAQGDA